MPSTNPLWLGSGGCPTIQVSAALYALNCRVVGFAEFGTQSSPPVYYRKYSTSGGWTFSSAFVAHPTWTQAGAGVGESNWAWDAATGVLAPDTGGGAIFDLDITITNHDNESNGPTHSLRLINESIEILSTVATVPSAAGLTVIPDPVTQFSGDLFPPLVSVVSQTKLRLTQTAQSDHGSPVENSVTSGAFDFDLGDPDTDADAIARASAAAGSPTAVGPFGPAVGDIFASGIFSLHEQRAASDFLYQGGTYQLNCANVAPGALYRYVVVWEGRDATGDGSGDTSGYGTSWTNTDSQSGTFRPTATTFATDPIALPVAAGKQKRIKSLSVTPIGE